MDALTLIAGLSHSEYVCLTYMNDGASDHNRKYWAHSACYLRVCNEATHPISNSTVLERYEFTFHDTLPFSYRQEECITCGDFFYRY